MRVNRQSMWLANFKRLMAKYKKSLIIWSKIRFPRSKSLTPIQRTNLSKFPKIVPNLVQNFDKALRIKSGIKSGNV